MFKFIILIQNYKMDSYYLVTAIFDIKKYYPGINRWRSATKYIELFSYFYELDVPTILFVEDHLVDKIKKSDKLHIINMNLSDLPAYQLIKNINNLRPISNGQHLNKEFTAVINSKLWLVDKSRQYLDSKNINFDHLVWLDAGIGHIGTIKPKKFRKNIKLHLHDKIVHCLMKAVTTREVENLDIYLQCTYGKIAAGIIAVPKNLIAWYAQELDTHYDYAINKLGLLCFEEQLMSVVVGRYPDRFNYIFSDYIGILKNFVEITFDLPCVLRNLTFCRENGLHDIGMMIVKLAFTSISKSKIFINEHEYIAFLYDAQIISFYKDKELCYNISLIINWLYHNKTTSKEWISSKIDNIKTNLSFINVNLEDENLVNEEKLFEIDIYDSLWKIY